MLMEVDPKQLIERLNEIEVGRGEGLYIGMRYNANGVILDFAGGPYDEESVPDTYVCTNKTFFIEYLNRIIAIGADTCILHLVDEVALILIYYKNPTYENRFDFEFYIPRGDPSDYSNPGEDPDNYGPFTKMLMHLD